MYTDHEANDQAMEVGLVPPVNWWQIRQKQAEMQRRAAAKQLRKERFAAILNSFKNLFRKSRVGAAQDL